MLPSGCSKFFDILPFQETDDFFNQFDVICGTGYCEFMLKKLDKKRERYVSKSVHQLVCIKY